MSQLKPTYKFSLGGSVPAVYRKLFFPNFHHILPNVSKHSSKLDVEDSTLQKRRNVQEEV